MHPCNRWCIWKTFINNYSLPIFYFVCLKVTWLALHQLRYMIDWKKTCATFSSNQVNPKPTITHSHLFSGAFCQLHVITLTFDSFTVLLLLATVITLVIWHSTVNHSMEQAGALIRFTRWLFLCSFRPLLERLEVWHFYHIRSCYVCTWFF